MKARNRIISLSLAMLVIVALAQACHPTSSDDKGKNPESIQDGSSGGTPGQGPDGNGDYYGGIKPPDDDVMKLTIESVEHSLRSMVSQIHPQVLVPPPPGDCKPATEFTCFRGLRLATYWGCTVSSSGSKLRGLIALKYNNDDCRLSAENDSVTNHYALLLTGPRGFSLETDTRSHENYEGETLPGGGLVTKTNDGWRLVIEGRRAVLRAPLGLLLADVSLRTKAPVAYSMNQPQALDVKSGKVEIFLNRVKLKAGFGMDRLSWNSTCCHPVSGTFDVAFDGSYRGQASIQYTGCGEAILNFGTGPRPLKLRACTQENPDQE